MGDDGLLDDCAVGLGVVRGEGSSGEGMLLLDWVTRDVRIVVLEGLVDEHETVDIIY